MPRSRALRNKFVDAPGSLGERMRIARWERFRRCFPGIENMSVVDLGGTAEMWLRAPVRAKRVHLINLEEHPAELPDWITAEVADVTDPTVAAELSARGGYDLVFSNSTIEHVGGHSQRRKFVSAVEQLAPRHWIQTPYRYFPVEPHFVAPGFQFLSLIHIHSRPDSPESAMNAVINIELLTRTEMRYLFPGSVLLSERVLGAPKSLIAVRTEPTC